MTQTQAIAAVIEKSGRFLLARRSPTKRTAAGYWCPITGRIEPGETEEQAVVREVFEEVGLHVTATRKIGEMDTRDKHARMHWWQTQITGGEAFIKCDENTELTWVTVEEMKLLHPIFEEDVAVFEKLAKK